MGFVAEPVYKVFEETDYQKWSACGEKRKKRKKKTAYATEFVYIVQYGYILSTVYFSIKYVINFVLLLAAVCVVFVTSINVFE